MECWQYHAPVPVLVPYLIHRRETGRGSGGILCFLQSVRFITGFHDQKSNPGTISVKQDGETASVSIRYDIPENHVHSWALSPRAEARGVSALIC